MNYFNKITSNPECPNSKLYEFLAVNYDISDLAQKIRAAKSAPNSILNLKKISSGMTA